MAGYGSIPYGGGPYGGGDAAPSTVSTIIPNFGLMTGGTQFTIIGNELSNEAYADNFEGIALDIGKWTDVSSGGTATVDDKLMLDAPKTGGLAGIRTNALYQDFDVEMSFSFNDIVQGFFPDSIIYFVRLIGRVDANNYVAIDHIWDPTRGPTLQVSMTTDSITSVITKSSIKGSARSLRLIRYNGRMLAYSGYKLLADFSGWRTDQVNIEIVSSNSGDLPLDTHVEVTSYLPRLLVTFGTSIAEFVTALGTRVTGLTPSTDTPVGVEVAIHSIDDINSLGQDSFTYTPTLQLTIAKSNQLSIVINDDDTLRDSSATQTGLRL